MTGMARTPRPICVFIMSTDVPIHDTWLEVSGLGGALYQGGTHITVVGSSFHDLTEDIVYDTYSPASRVVATEGLATFIVELPILLAEPTTFLVSKPIRNIEMFNILSRRHCRRTGHLELLPVLT